MSEASIEPGSLLDALPWEKPTWVIRPPEPGGRALPPRMLFAGSAARFSVVRFFKVLRDLFFGLFLTTRLFLSSCPNYAGSLLEPSQD
jgi:hypothetical protein